MAKYQVWSRDEYGQGNIIHTTEDIQDAIKRAKQEVTNLNVQNALTATDRENNWEAYFVNVKTSAKKSKTTYVYGSLDVHAKDRVYAITDSGVKDMVLSEVPKAEVEIYLGDVSVKRGEDKDWLGSDLRVRPITTTDSADLQAKTIFFIKKVK